MKKFTITKKTLEADLKTVFPKYTASIMNLSNSTGNLTSKRNIGPLHEYFEEFKKTYTGTLFTIENWKKFYEENKNGKELLEMAIKKNLENIEKFKEAIALVDESLIREYIHDLTFKKTFIGMNYEYLAVALFAKKNKINSNKIRKSSSKEESTGIDMWISNIPIQVKPKDSWKANDQNVVKNGLVLYYKKEADNKFSIEYDEEKYKELNNDSGSE